ncbi:hypothetical protein HBZS_119980 [Helicobacter bizzozeronii CCUG 35545]|nr:hypothetical protein HBZS_119980 [Helicobacter bizzozeronii CCUG 35545]
MGLPLWGICDAPIDILQKRTPKAKATTTRLLAVMGDF